MESSSSNTKSLLIFALIVVLVAVAAYFFVFKKPSGPVSVSENGSDLQIKYRAGASCPDIIALADKYLDDESDDLSVLLMKGHCQFELKKYDDAKLTFEKVLSIDALNESAKNYLTNIDKVQNGFVTFVNPEKDVFDKDYVAQKLGFDLEEAGLYFNTGAILDKGDGSKTLKFTASYIPKSTTVSITSVASSIDSLLSKKSIKYEKITMDGGSLQYIFRTSAKTEPFVGFTFSIVNKQPISVGVNYEK